MSAAATDSNVKVGDWRRPPPGKEPQLVFIDGFDGTHVMAIGVIVEGPWRGCRVWRFDETVDVAAWPLAQPTTFEAAVAWAFHRRVADDERTTEPVRRQSRHAADLLAGQWPGLNDQEGGSCG